MIEQWVATSSGVLGREHMAQEESQGKTIEQIEMEAAEKVLAARNPQEGQVRVKRRTFVDRIIEAVRSAPFTAEELKELKAAVENRFVSKTCFRCGKIKVVVDGELVWPDGDMSKPKRFVCKDCK